MKLDCPIAVDAEGLRRAMSRAVQAELDAVREEAKANCPKDTGRLSSSITVRMGEGGGEIAASAPYAVHVEMGTAYMPARPFLYPALRAHQAAIVQRAAQAAMTYLREARRRETAFDSQ